MSKKQAEPKTEQEVLNGPPGVSIRHKDRRLGALKKELDRWQLFFYWGRDHNGMPESGWRCVELWVVNIHTFPQAGENLVHKHFRGFTVRFKYWLPWELA